MKSNKFYILYLLILSLFEFRYSQAYIYYENEFIGYEFNIFKYLFVFVFKIYLLYIIKKSYKRNFIFCISLIFYTFIFFPNAVFYQFNDVTPLFFLSSFLFIYLINKLKIKKIRFDYTINKGKENFLLILSVFLFIPILLKFGTSLNFNLFFLEDIYLVRNENLDTTSAFYGYLTSFLSKVILPFGILIALNKKKYFHFIILFLIINYLFLIEGSKSVLFSSILIILIFFINSFKKIIYYKIISLFILLLIGYISTEYYDNFIFESIIFKRALFTTPELNLIYFDFFKDSYLYLSHSILKYFITYPYYITNPSYLIGYEYFNNINHGANNGFLSDGFMNFGYFGVFIYILLVCYIFLTIDKLKISPKYFGIILIIIMSIISSPLNVVLLTHGVILSIIFFYLFLRDSIYEN